MTISITRDQLAAMNPCDAESRLKMFGRRKTMNVKQALAAGATISDILWVAGQLGLKRQSVQFALACAQRVAHLNTDPRVQKALGATQLWLDADTDAAGDAARAAWAASWATEAAGDAARAAEAAGDASWAAEAAGDAARAASWATEAAAWAAWAARDAAWDAAWDAEIEAQKALLIEIFS
jgi:hypothetical protein